MRICLVASEILGAHKNGGIGTATSNLALFFAERGHQVRLVYTGTGEIDYDNRWTSTLALAGVQTVHLRSESSPLRPDYLKESSVLFEYLRYSHRELIIFQDWRGAAFGCISARDAGVAFSSCRLVVIAHGPTKWLIDANRTVLSHPETLAHLRMEQVVLEGADEVLCPSDYMRKWLATSRYTFRKTSAMPLYLWADSDEISRTAPLTNVQRLAFFGRLEERKGIELFLRALADLNLPDGQFQIAFLGKEATWSVEQITEFFITNCPSLLSRVTFETNLDSASAQDYLIANDCLAIIPSLVDNAPCVISECIRRKIPFLTTRTGGIPELIADHDHQRILVEPTARTLARRIEDAVGSSFDPVGSAYLKEDIATRWLDWIDRQKTHLEDAREESGSALAQRLLATSNAAKPTTAVVLTHYERPLLLNQCLASLSVQSDCCFELILVDDGSVSSAALLNLDHVERAEWPFKISVLRLPKNRYLGAARNAGVKASDASRIIFLDDDNLAHPNMVETLSNAQILTGADIVTCEMAVFRDSKHPPTLRLSEELERWGFIGGPSELGISFNCFGDATAIYKRAVFERIGFFHELYGVGHEDWHFHARAALAGLRFASLPIPLYWYRRLNNGMLVSTDNYVNNKIIWDLYYDELPAKLRRFADLSMRNAYAHKGL